MQGLIRLSQALLYLSYNSFAGVPGSPNPTKPNNQRGGDSHSFFFIIPLPETVVSPNHLVLTVFIIYGVH